MNRLAAVLYTILLSAFVAAPATAQHRGAFAPGTVTFPAGQKVVEMDFELDRDKIVVPVSVNGSEPLRFVIDTGAPVMVLMRTEIAQSLDLDIIGEVQLAGAGSENPGSAPLAGDVSFDIGGVSLDGAAMVVGIGDKFPKTGYEGIIGSDLFHSLVVEFDFDSSKLRLYRPDDYEKNPGSTELPLSFTRDVFPALMSQVNIDGKGAVPASLVIDTGAAHALSLITISSDDIKKPARTVDAVLGWGASGAVEGAAGRVARLEFGGFVFDDVVCSFPKPGAIPMLASGDTPHHGYLGIKTFKRFRTAFDYTNSRLILEPTSMFDEPFVWNRSGLLPLPSEPGAVSLEVADVVDRSPADAAGIRAGDAIVAINGRDVADIQPRDVHNILTQTPGTEVTFTLLRGETRIDKKIVLEDLI